MRIDHAGFDTDQLKTAEVPVWHAFDSAAVAPFSGGMKRSLIPATAKGCSWRTELTLIWICCRRFGAEGARDGSLTLTLVGRFAPPVAGRIICP